MATIATKASEPVAIKRIHSVDGICFMVFDKSIVEKLQLDNGELWAEQRIIPGGIGLNLRRRSQA